MTRKGRSVPKSSMHDTGIDELRRLVGLIGANVNGRVGPICEFIRTALLAGKPSTKIADVLKADVFPIEGDVLKREDLLPAYVRLGLIHRPRAAGPAMEKIGDIAVDILGKFN